MEIANKEGNVIDILVDALSEIGHDQIAQRKINNLLMDKHNFKMGEAYALMRNVTLLNDLDEIELACFMNICYQVSKIESINPKLHFTQNVFKQAERYKAPQDEITGLPYTFRGVLRGACNSFLTILTYKEIYKLFDAILNYNYDTQRIAKMKMKKGELIKEPKVYKKSVQKIYELMKKGEYPPSTLLINILENGESEIVYEDGNLTVLEGSQVDLIDGYHRVLAIVKLISEIPSFEGYMNVDIKHYDLTKARKLLAITNTTNPFDKTQRMKFASATFGSEVVNELEKLPEFKNRISSKGTVSKTLGEYTTFSVMTESIDTVFDIQNAKERFDITKFLKNFYSYFLAYYEDMFKNRTLMLEQTWFVHHNMFVLFNVVAKKMYDKHGQEAPFDQISDILNKIDFRKNVDSPLNNILVTQGKVNSTKIKKDLLEFAKKNIKV